jgi:class 3 adenylate cyclase
MCDLGLHSTGGSSATATDQFARPPTHPALGRPTPTAASTRAPTKFFAVSRGRSACRAIEAQQAIADHAAQASRHACACLHTGRPTLTSSGYIGLSVHTVARVCAVGHGGQILLTQATVRAAGAALPAGLEMVGLGPYRLAGLPEPVELVQATPAGGLRDFPPLRVG